MKKELSETASEKNSTRRDFLKYSGVLGSAAILSNPILAMAAGEAGGMPQGGGQKPEGMGAGMGGGAGTGMGGGKGGERLPLPQFDSEQIGKALKVLFKTYANQRPYQHKFNDALTKSWLNSIDFAVQKGIQKEFITHYINTMMPILHRAKVQIASFGPEVALTTTFDGTMCSIQLFEEITVKPGERSFPCPYVGILEVCKPLKMFSIEWKDVCNNLCIPLYSGFGKEMGVDIKMTPGETCYARI